MTQNNLSLKGQTNTITQLMYRLLRNVNWFNCKNEEMLRAN